MIDQTKLTVLREFAETNMKKVATTGGGEYHGPCPFCGGHDRFVVQPNADNGGRWFCRKCTPKGGDTIAFVMKDRNLPETKAGYREACRVLGLSSTGGGAYSAPTAPAPAQPERVLHVSEKSETWRRRAGDFVAYAERTLWNEEGTAGRAYLHGRGLSDETIRAARLGWNPSTLHVKPAEFGLDRDKAVWLPAGLVIPHHTDGQLLGVRFRPEETPKNGNKYLSLPGSAFDLYRGDLVGVGGIVAIVEGEIDALTLAQECGDLVRAVGTCSNTGGRSARSEATLALADTLLLCFDADHAGEEGARYWEAFTHARRLLPTRHDVNEMHTAGENVRAWIAAAIGADEPAPARQYPVSDADWFDNYLMHWPIEQLRHFADTAYNTYDRALYELAIVEKEHASIGGRR